MESHILNGNEYKPEMIIEKKSPVVVAFLASFILKGEILCF